MKSSLLRAVVFAVLSLLLQPFVWAQPSADAATPAFTRTIYLIRHGAYDTVTKGDEAKVNALTPLGLAEARLIAARLRGLPVSFDTLTSSTLTRARQTADVINQMFPQLTHETSAILCECTPRARGMDMTGRATPEQLDAAEAQLNQAFATYFIPAKDRNENDIIVCHGNVIRYFVMKALGVDPQAWLGLGVAHCSLTVIQVTPKGTCRVLAVGDVGHIPANMLSGITRNDPELVAP